MGFCFVFGRLGCSNKIGLKAFNKLLPCFFVKASGDDYCGDFIVEGVNRNSAIIQLSDDVKDSVTNGAARLAYCNYEFSGPFRIQVPSSLRHQ